MPTVTSSRSRPRPSRCAAAGARRASRSATPRTSPASTRARAPPAWMAEARPRWSPATWAVHGGLPEPRQGEPFLPGPAFAAPYHLSGDPESSDYGYGRRGNPTWTAYERALGELEGGEAVAFASGMAAVTAVLLGSLEAGDAVVLPADGYFTVRAVAARLAEGGVRPRM